MVSGDIHEELKITNEFPLPVQTEKAGNLLGEVLLILASQFKKVYVWEVSADNHGRLNKKPQYKQRALNNMSYLVHAIANAKVAHCKNVIIKATDGIKLVADVMGSKFLIEHGNDTKCYMGIPYYGIERSTGREARRRMNTDKTFNYRSIGHWHVPAVIGNQIFVNGCLTGTTEFDHALGRCAAPSQCAMFVGSHGHFGWTAFEG